MAGFVRNRWQVSSGLGGNFHWNQWQVCAGLRNLAEALSFGQQKLLSLGCCLATEAEYLLLDEPVSGVNPQMIEKILKLLQELSSAGRKILLIEHNIEAVRSVCDWLIVMDEGKKIAEGLPDEVLQKEEIIEAYLD